MSDTDTPPRLYPTRLSLTNLQGLAAFNLEVSDRRLTLLAGPNGIGKTTVLKAFDMTIRGASKCPDEPIKIGENDSVIRLTLREGLTDKYEIVRSMRRKDDGTLDNKLHVYDISGETRAGVRKPQTMLDGITNAVAFRPADIMKDGANRLKLLLHAIGKQVEYDDNRAKYVAIYEGRAQVNRDVTDLAGRLAATPNPDPSQILKHIDSAAAALALEDINKRAHERDALNTQQAQACNQVNGFTQQIQLLESQRVAAREIAARCETALADFAEVETDKAATELKRIEKHNITAAGQDAHHKLAAALTAKRSEADTQSTELKALDAGLAKMVSESTIGQQIPGLSMSGNKLQYNGHPFDQASSRQQRELAMLIGIAANPTLRASFIDEADGIDDDGLRHFAELAEKHDMFLFFAGARLPAETLADVAQFIEVDKVAAKIVASRPPPAATHIPAVHPDEAAFGMPSGKLPTKTLPQRYHGDKKGELIDDL